MTKKYTRQCFYFNIFQCIFLMLCKISYLCLRKFYIVNYLLWQVCYYVFYLFI